jgi:hypothetical protein
LFLKAAAGTPSGGFVIYRAKVPKPPGFARPNGRPDRQFAVGRIAKPARAGAGA